MFIEATRASVLGSADPSNVTYPSGSIALDPAAREISGSNAERQDFIIGPNPARSFSGYFVARFDTPFAAFGTTTAAEEEDDGTGKVLGGYAVFGREVRTVEVRVGVSFVSVEQARRNLEREVPDGTTLEQTARTTRAAWAEKLDRVRVWGGSREQLVTFYTALFHTLQVCGPVFAPRRFGASLTLSRFSSTRMNRTRRVSTTRDTMTRYTKASRILATRSG